MDEARIRDADYINYLPGGFYRNRYKRWKSRMVLIVDDLVDIIKAEGLEAGRAKYSLTDNDIGMLVRLNYVDQDFAEVTGMADIERAIPL